MTDTKTTASSSGIGVTGLLGVLFIALKLTHYIDWPWKWVLAPFWIPWALIGVALFLWGAGWLLITAIEYASRRRRHRRFLASKGRP